MEIRLHANATTTPQQRAYIQQSSRPTAELAVEIGVSETTIRRGRSRDTVRDRPHTPHRWATTLNPMQEFVVVELRKRLLLPLDDLLVVAREFVCPDVSRSALDRCLRRHGGARLVDLLPEAEGKPPLPKTVKDYEPGFVHVDVTYLPRMPDEAEHRSLIAAIDRANRWVYYEIQPDKRRTRPPGSWNASGPKPRFASVPSSLITARNSPTASAPPRGTPAHWPARLRPNLHPPRHRPSADPAPTPANQRDDRTLQRPRRRGVENDPLRLGPAFGNHLANVSSPL